MAPQTELYTEVAKALEAYFEGLHRSDVARLQALGRIFRAKRVDFG